MLCSKHCSFKKMIFEWLFWKCSGKCNAMKSNPQWNNAMKNNQEGRQVGCRPATWNHINDHIDDCKYTEIFRNNLH